MYIGNTCRISILNVYIHDKTLIFVGCMDVHVYVHRTHYYQLFFNRQLMEYPLRAVVDVHTCMYMWDGNVTIALQCVLKLE